MLSYGGATFEHNAMGQRTSKTVGSEATAYDYDELGNLVGVDLPDKTIDYVVDGFNRRVARKVDGAVTNRYLYGQGLLPVAELNADGGVKSRFVFASKAHVPDYMVKGGVTYRFVTDQVGSVRLVVNTSDGTITQSIDYDPFGRVTTDTNPSFQPFGFAGGLYDSDTGLVRFGARDYDAETGRWTAKEPMGFGGGDPNLYNYVGNDPGNFIDPTGEIAWFAIFAAGVAIYEIGSAIVDTFSTVSTLADSCATTGEKLLSAALWAAGIFAPGGGYSTAARHLDDVASLSGASLDEIARLVPEGWVGTSTKRGDGVRWLNPDRPGEAIRVMQGNPADPNPLKRGPYLRISKDGNVTHPIPLKGNPTLP